MNRPCVFLLFLIVFIQGFYGSNCQAIDLTFSYGEKPHKDKLREFSYDEEPSKDKLIELSQKHDWWLDLRHNLAGGGGEALSIIVFIFINLHLVFIRGCAEFIVNYFLPFYIVTSALLSVAFVIPMFGESKEFENARITCYLLAVGTVTCMAFVTPVYFFCLAIRGEVDEVQYPDRYDEVPRRLAGQLLNYDHVQHPLWIRRSVEVGAAARPEETEAVGDVRASASTSKEAMRRSFESTRESSNENVGARKRIGKARGKSKGSKKSKSTSRQRR